MEADAQDQQDQPHQHGQYRRPAGGPLRRPYHDRMVAGVAAGIAEQAGIDVTIVRIVLAVLCVVGGLGIPLYLAAWLLVPDEGHDESIAAEWLSHVH
jgi:phage shock protein C